MSLHNYLEKHYTASTATSYGREIAGYLAGNPSAPSASYADIIGYLGLLRERYNNPNTLHRMLCSIKVYYDYLCATGQRQDHPAKIIQLKDRRHQDVQLQDLFTTKELDQLLARKERYGALYYRNKVLMGLLVYQGLRVIELAVMSVYDINLEAGTVYVGSTPGTNSRTLSLQPNQVLLLYSYLQGVRPKLLKHTESDALLIGQRGKPMQAADIVKHVMRSCKGVYPGRRVTALTIRQSVIANLLLAKHDIGLVQQFAGHKYPSSTERYRHGEIATLKAAVDQYHPQQ